MALLSDNLFFFSLLHLRLPVVETFLLLAQILSVGREQHSMNQFVNLTCAITYFFLFLPIMSKLKSVSVFKVCSVKSFDSINEICGNVPVFQPHSPVLCTQSSLSVSLGSHSPGSVESLISCCGQFDPRHEASLLC